MSCTLMLQMVFLDFFEALLGCAEVYMYVVEASEQPDVTARLASVEQPPDTTEQIAPSTSHSLSLVEQVLLSQPCALCCTCTGCAKNVPS